MLHLYMLRIYLLAAPGWLPRARSCNRCGSAWATLVSTRMIGGRVLCVAGHFASSGRFGTEELSPRAAKRRCASMVSVQSDDSVAAHARKRRLTSAHEVDKHHSNGHDVIANARFLFVVSVPVCELQYIFYRAVSVTEVLALMACAPQTACSYASRCALMYAL